MIKAGDCLFKAPISIDDTTSISAMELPTKVRRLKAKKGLDLIVIDYLLLTAGKTGGHGDNR